MFNLREPTPEEHREASELWYNRIGKTLIDQWPADVLALSMPTKFIRFPMDLMETLFEPNRWPHPGIDDLAAQLDAAMGWDRHFVRLNSRSPKDAPWPFEVPATCSGKEALSMFAGSERIMEDLIQFKYLPEHPAMICLREFVPGMRPDGEFRCFVRDGEIIAVTHYDYHNPHPEPLDGGRAIRERIEAWFSTNLKPRLHIQTVVFDVFLPWGEDVMLIELNAYGLSDPCWLKSYAAVENFSGFVAFSNAPAEASPRPTEGESSRDTVLAKTLDPAWESIANLRGRHGQPIAEPADILPPLPGGET